MCHTLPRCRSGETPLSYMWILHVTRCRFGDPEGRTLKGTIFDNLASLTSVARSARSGMSCRSRASRTHKVRMLRKREHDVLLVTLRNTSNPDKAKVTYIVAYRMRKHTSSHNVAASELAGVSHKSYERSECFTLG